MTESTFGNALTAWREREGLSRSEAAEMFGCTRVSVWNWETRGVLPRSEMLMVVHRETRGAVGLGDVSGDTEAA